MRKTIATILAAAWALCSLAQTQTQSTNLLVSGSSLTTVNGLYTFSSYNPGNQITVYLGTNYGLVKDVYGMLSTNVVSITNGSGVKVLWCVAVPIWPNSVTLYSNAVANGTLAWTTNGTPGYVKPNPALVVDTNGVPNNYPYFFQTNAEAIASAIGSHLGVLASTSYVNNAVAPLASTQYVAAAVSGLASTQFVNAATSPLASTGYVSTAISALASNLPVLVAATPNVTITIDGVTNFISVTGGGGTYVPPSVSLYNDQNVVEMGRTISTTLLTWTLSGATVTNQSLNQGIGTINATNRTYTDTASYTSDRTYTLTVSDGVTPASDSTSVYFQRKQYWGLNANASLSDADIKALSSGFASTKAKSEFSVQPTGQYIYYCYPAAFGTATIKANAFPVTDWGPTTQSFQNASGHTEDYLIYRSPVQYFDGNTYLVIAQ